MDIKQQIKKIKEQLNILEKASEYKTGDWVIHERYGVIQIEGMPGDKHYDERCYGSKDQGFSFHSDTSSNGKEWSFLFRIQRKAYDNEIPDNFKNGDYAVVIQKDHAQYGDVVRLEKYTIGRLDFKSIKIDGLKGDGFLKQHLRKATISEIENALIKQAIKFGFYDTSKYVKNLLRADSKSHLPRPLQPFRGKYEKLEYRYHAEHDTLYCTSGLITQGKWCSNPCIYEKGKWAEVIDKSQIEKPITINGYDAKFHDEYVKFGCAEINNDIFISLSHLIQRHTSERLGGNRTIKHVTIGDGEFDVDTIEEIAERIRNK